MRYVRAIVRFLTLDYDNDNDAEGVF